ncbi:DDHD domain-containing protein [Lipomyces tetrasporus]|uniref:DDHD domain-containing protein n=1 Tax=Lipomyces tetrasporus TaxID=54092 RepID=A0AAD7QZ77_9ASCO|nr:DDHD domain-containing protein [Lipomyces tetrasporus]KAJ8102497.1 DDHD domain-containing protein [Lipomyces tetrasporus]
MTTPVAPIKVTAGAASAAATSGSLSTSSGLHGSVDHTVPYRHRMSHRDLPPDTPPLVIRWYFATDVPKRKPFVDKDWKPPKPPSKFVPFSVTDSRNIEAAYQQKDDSKLETVAVNEDRLFQVDIRKRELSPIYWNGPTYDVRRGTWFYADSSSLKPCDENLANQIEEGYLKNQPFRKPAHVPPPPVASDSSTTASQPSPMAAPPPRSHNSQPQGTSQTENFAIETEVVSHKRASSFTESITSAFTFRSRSPPVSNHPPRSQSPSSDRRAQETDKPAPPPAPPSTIAQQTETWPLYGPHIGKYVVYSNDATSAWIISDDFYGKFASTIYQRLTAGANMGGVKLVRGWSDVNAKPASKPLSATAAANSASDNEEGGKNASESTSPSDPTAELVEAIHTSSMASMQKETNESQEAQDNALLEQQMEKDYNPNEDEDQNREIEHLVLCIHGIGQKLGQRLESVNFVGDVNTFRKTMKSVYSTSPDLQALNGETGNDVKKLNSRIQVLPVCWRHSIQFGLQQERDDDPAKSRKEQDIGDLEEENGKEDPETATLQDITVDGVPALRGIISEVLLDILLYYQPNYRERIMNNVSNECNHIYHLFRKWNPGFKGRISIAGHSLGAAIAFDILCRQPDDPQPSKSKSPKLTLDFDVDSFFGLGSPVGLFQMLKGKTIAPRTVKSIEDQPLSPLDFDLDNPFEDNKKPTGTVSTPKVEDIYNVFHPADPISYRLEPLIVKRMAELKPQAIPSTRKGINTQIANLAELTQRVAQSASNMWSSMASGLASTILNKSLGYEGDTSANLSGTGDVANSGASSSETSSTFRQDLAITIHNPPESGVETLYSKFQKESGKLTKVAEEQAKLQRDEELIRGLNYTGRLDFSLPEGYMDITLLASMGSHLGYFRDPDVANFVIGQLLARPFPKRLKSVKLKKQKYQSLT